MWCLVWYGLIPGVPLTGSSFHLHKIAQFWTSWEKGRSWCIPGGSTLWMCKLHGAACLQQFETTYIRYIYIYTYIYIYITYCPTLALFFASCFCSNKLSTATNTATRQWGFVKETITKNYGPFGNRLDDAWWILISPEWYRTMGWATDRDSVRIFVGHDHSVPLHCAEELEMTLALSNLV